MEFPGKKYWTGLPFPSPGDRPNPGIEPASLMSHTLAGRFFTVWAPREAHQMGLLLCCSVTQLCLTLSDPMDCSMPGLIISQSLPRLIASVMPSRHLILWCPLLLLPSIRDFSNESAVRIKWPKYWSFSFSISPSSEYLGLLCLKIDWFDLLVVQGTFRGLLQNYSSKASILWHSVFLMVQLSQSYMTTGKTIALAIRAFVGKVMFLLFYTLSSFVNTFLLKKQLSSDFTAAVTVHSDFGAQEEICHFSLVAQSCLTLCNPMDWSMPGFPTHHQLLEPTKTHVHRVGDAIQPSHPLSSPSPPPSIFPSVKVFSNELVLHIRWPKYWSFSFNISPSNEYSGLISFRMDWLDLLSVQGTLKSLL